MASSTPQGLGDDLHILLSFLGVSAADCRMLALTAVAGFIPVANDCHVNVMIQCRLAGGHARYGWLLWENDARDRCQAMFHSVWQEAGEDFIDITPRADDERLVMFVPDRQREITFVDRREGQTIYGYDNVCLTHGGTPTALAQLKHVVAAGTSARYGLKGMGH